MRHWVAVLEGAGIGPAEIVLANDGSTDGTGEVLARLARELPCLRVVTSHPNHGYGFALGNAIAASRGEVVVTLDSDGQFDLAGRPLVLAAYRERGLDFVTGYRVKKRDDALRVAADRGLNLLVRGLFGVALRDTNCAMSSSAETSRARAPHRGARLPHPHGHLILQPLRTLGAKTAEAPVSHAERLAGRSKLSVLPTSVSMLRFLLYLRRKIRSYEAGVLQVL